MGKEVSIFWFRRDLRIEDNIGLTRALEGPNPVVPIFIFDPSILNELDRDDARLTFIHQCLLGIQEALLKKGSDLKTFHCPVVEAFDRLAEEYTIRAVFTNTDYEPYARERDGEIANWAAAHNISFNSFKDQVIFEKSEVVKSDGNPYVVYTPYMKAWRVKLEQTGISDVPSPNWEQLDKDVTGGVMTMEQIGFTPSGITVPAFHLTDQSISSYLQTRDIPSKDKGTSRLGPHLRFGTVSIRQITRMALDSRSDGFLKELIWREFFMQILWHFPHTVDKAFKPAYDRITWRNNKEDFEAWKEGCTGYPLVDAGMRQLKATGYMHNRVRMLTASFLCKHLLIDWRWGEAHFARHLLDFELSSNVGNWQWAAGSGVDAAPYFRIFNPMTQHKKFDPQSKYIGQWVPEFLLGSYPEPIIDHKQARERCLETYKAALQ